MKSHTRSNSIDCPPGGPTAEAPEAGYEPCNPFDELLLHDLLNPMTGLQGDLELLEETLGPQADAATRQRLQGALESSRELSSMLVNLRCLAQLQAGSLSLRLRTLPLRTLLNSVTSDPSWPGTEQVRLTCPVPDRHVRASGNLLEHALHVLLQSALRLQQDDHIELSAFEAANGNLRVECAYHGATIPDELQEVLFTPQIESAQRSYNLRIDRAYGLTVVQHIVQLLGASVYYQPASEGGRFGMWLPEAGTDHH
jgi:K+-sensing histidine kinase KdpD